MKTKVVFVSLLFLVFGLSLESQVPAQRTPRQRPANAQRPAKQAANANAAAAQDVGPDTPPEVVKISRQNLPQDPLRIAINNAVQKGMQEAKQNPAAGQSIQNASGNTPQNAPQSNLPNAAAGSVPNAAANISPNNAIQQNAPPNVAANVAPAASTPPDATTPNARANRPPQGQRALAVPAEFQAGITAMQSAGGYLQNAGNKWGGHKVKAVNLINQALVACGQPRNSPAGANSGATDESSAVQSALTQMTSARDVFAGATDAWDGRRDQALALINQAISEIQAGIDFAKSHSSN